MQLLADADKQDALVVALTVDGTIYVASIDSQRSLADRVRMSIHAERQNSHQVDARVPYAPR